MQKVSFCFDSVLDSFSVDSPISVILFRSKKIVDVLQHNFIQSCAVLTPMVSVSNSGIVIGIILCRFSNKLVTPSIFYYKTPKQTNKNKQTFSKLSVFQPGINSFLLNITFEVYFN